MATAFDEKAARAHLRSLSLKELSALVEATDSWAHQDETKFHIYKPAPIANLFHVSGAKTRAFFGGNRSSKTYSHVIDYAIQFTGEVPKSLEGTIPEWRVDPTRRNRMCMGDYPNSMTKVIWPYIEELIPRRYIADVVKDSGRVKAITNDKGGFLEFMQYDQDVSKFQGTSRHSIGCDEEPPQLIRKENAMRIIDTDGEETFSLTPVSGALKYLYDEIFLKRGREFEKDYDFILNNKDELVDVIAKEMRDVVLKSGNPDIHVFFACIFDNPAIPKEAAIRILSMFPKEEMIMRGKGHFMFLSGLVFKEYDQRKHVIPSFDDWWKGSNADQYTMYYAIDPHPRTPHAVVIMAVDKNDNMYVVDELFMDTTAPKLVSAIKAKLMGRFAEDAIIDPFASTPDPSTKSCLLIDLIEAGLNDPMPRPGSKDVEGGIIATRKAFSEDRLFITDNCTRTIGEIGSYAWDDWKHSMNETKGEKQIPIKKNDHMMENLRRLISLEPRYVRPNYNEEEEYVRENFTRETTMTGY